ncbi:MAG: hypothetical protein WD988_00800 [Candidatus Curtissbacteria bacterium]
MRSDEWLEEKLQYLLKNYFSDMPITNPLEIRFGREAKFRFGSIRLVKPAGLHFLTSRSKPQKSIIMITAMFARDDVPQEVVLYTISHELCHYAHGFSSTNKRLFRHPHHGGVVNSEIKKRGGEKFIEAYKQWIREYRKKILEGRAKI